MGKRADGRTTTTIAIDKDVLEFLKKEALKKNSNVSNYIEDLARDLKKEKEENENAKK